MIYIIITVAVLVVGVALYLLHQYTRFDFAYWYMTLITIGVSLLIIGALSMLAIRKHNRDFILQGNTLQQVLIDSRTNGTSDVERAAILTRVVEYNTELSMIQYWYPKTEAWFGIFRDPDIFEIRPVK